MNDDLIKLIYSSDGEISIERIPYDEGICFTGRVYSYVNANTKQSGIYVVSTDLVSAKQRMLESMRADIIRLKAEVAKASKSYQDVKKKLSELTIENYERKN